MSTIEQSIEVAVPVRTAYNQWTQFEEFPRFMEGVEEVGALGTLLGLVPDPTLIDVRAELGAGDTLLLYTDGITEARAPERVVSEEELRAAVARDPGGSAQALIEHVAAVAVGKEGTPPRDDMALLALRARG